MPCARLAVAMAVTVPAILCHLHVPGEHLELGNFPLLLLEGKKTRQPAKSRISTSEETRTDSSYPGWVERAAVSNGSLHCYEPTNKHSPKNQEGGETNIFSEPITKDAASNHNE